MITARFGPEVHGQPWEAAAKRNKAKIKSKGGSEGRVSHLEQQEGGKLAHSRKGNLPETR